MSDDADRLNPALTAAVAYTQRGWSVIPVPHRSKNPGRDGWQRLRLREADLPERFAPGPCNIGVLTGEPSGWLIDIDFDHQRCVDRAAEFLPPTTAIFGREGNPRSHWLYRVSGPAATKKFKSRSAGMLAEFRSTGQQTVFPPSTHESGESIVWEHENPEPPLVDPAELLACVQRLVDAVKIELGEKAAPKKATSRSSNRSPARSQTEPATETEEPSPESAPRIVEGGRNDALTSLAGKLRYWGAELAEIAAQLHRENQRRCLPPLDEEEVQSIACSVARYPVGAACLQTADDTEQSGQIPLGQRDPQTCRLVLSPRRTLPTAEAFVRLHYSHHDGLTIVSHAGALWSWRGNRYQQEEEGALRSQLQPWLHRAVRYALNQQTHELELIDFESNPSSVNAALETLRDYVHLPLTNAAPSWLIPSANDPPPVEILPCQSILLHLPTQQRIAATPRFFTHNALDFDPDPTAAIPVAWLTFLHQLFDGDLQALELLQEWFGLCLVAETKYQKMLLIVGPRRSGKGTLARVLARLVGLANVCAPTTSALAGPFGLQPLISKSLAIVSDARFHGENITTVVERLLCISGEDTLTIDRKHMTSVTLKLATRFLFLSNELPSLHEASSALAGRFLILRLTESFYGREDLGLTERLLTELPAILNWAIAGWQRLHARGHFVMPESSQEAVQELEHLSSPVLAFVRDRCDVGATHRVGCNALFAAWQGWCRDEGFDAPGTKQSFGRNLAAAIGGLSSRRGTGNVRFYQGIGLREGGR